MIAVSSDLLEHLSLEAYTDLVLHHQDVCAIDAPPDTEREPASPEESATTMLCIKPPISSRARVIVIPESDEE